MPASSKHSKEEITEAIALAKEVGSTEAGRRMRINRRTIDHWVYHGEPKNVSKTPSQLITELAQLITRYGPEISYPTYTACVENPGTFRSYWKTWVDFRNEAYGNAPYAPEYNRRVFVEVKDALIVIGSDAHYHPYWGQSTAHRAMLMLPDIIKPTHIILNGDIPDFPQVTHHRPIAWKKVPTMDEELAEVDLRVGEIESAYAGCERYWNWGNHCIRHDNRLAEKIPEYRDRPGMKLPHHYPKWRFQNTLRFNEYELEVKHRFKGGMYATRNNVINAGISMCVGHDHNRQSYRFRNARGTCYGFDPGCMAELFNPSFEYQECNTYNHASGLAVVTFINGKMMPPELVEIDEPGKAWFRGRAYEV